MLIDSQKLLVIILSKKCKYSAYEKMFFFYLASSKSFEQVSKGA